ncbi:MAG: hypothetical protein LUF30_11860, partial [Lachnospiraceae bacterium]|nr:hypothetical protein [Lachnospiraceae bacterium]
SYSSATDGLPENITESYQMTLGDLYDTAHSEKISEWAATFNYKYRAQCYAITGQDICSSAMSVDIPEGDNSSKGDGLRKMASVVNVGNKESFSMEAVTATGNLKMNWGDVVNEVAQIFSDGVNHVVLHGYPYVKTVNGYYSDWPGWTAFGNNFAGSYAHWRCDWEDMDLLAGYIARNQAVLQSGTAKVDLAVLNDTTTGASLSDGNTFQQLLDHGYSYNMFTEALMESDQAVVTNGVLAESGPAYKALIVNAVSVISAEGMAKVLEYANAGLPVILYKCNISDIYGLATDINSQDLLLDSYDELTVLDNVMTASTEDEIETILAAMGVAPAASYSASKLETSHYVDEIDGSDFYYMYNNVVPSNTGMSNGKNSEYKEGETIETTVTLTGNGVPYKLDAWTGTAKQLAEYIVNEDGSYSFDVTLSGGDSVIYAVLSGKEEQLHVEVSGGSADYTEDGALVYKSNEAGTVTLALSDGTEQEVTIAQTLDSTELTSGWSLTLESWGPADEYYADENIDTERTEKSSTGVTVYVDPSLAKVTTEEFAIDTLGNWADINATEEQLDNLGVESMQYVSGVGYYTNTFSLPDGWDETTGAVLVLEYSQVMVTEVTVNGTTIRGINNASDQVDIGAYLQTGENTITVKIDSPMYNRMRGEERIAIMDTSGMNMTGQEPIDTGLLSVTLNPYTMVELG